MTDHRPPWRERLALIVDLMRSLSEETEPQAMVKTYGERIRELHPIDRLMSISRRGVEAPRFRIARCTSWDEEINPWKERERLPVMSGGLLGDLVFAGEPQILDDLRVDPEDPGAPYFEDMRSLVSIPVFDGGEALNVVVLMRSEAAAFDREYLPEMVWTSNLLGRATHNLVLSEELRCAHEQINRELAVVGEIQRSLLPRSLPEIPTLSLASSYQTSRTAGGDYFDVFRLPEGRFGLLIADVSGHGTPAAVMMAITHSLAHSYPGPTQPPARMLEFLNQHLVDRYTGDSGTFVTAFYAVYEPRERRLCWSSAGHNPPRLQRAADGFVRGLDGAVRPPIGILDGQEYVEDAVTLEPGDRLVLYTDGLSEARSPDGAFFGVDGLDRVIRDCDQGSEELVASLLEEVSLFTHGAPAHDDRTLLVAKVS